MKRIGRFAIVAALLGIGTTAFLLWEPPYLTRIRVFHGVHADGMTKLARTVVEHPKQFEWVAMSGGKVSAGVQDNLIGGVELEQSTKDLLRPLFDEASLYFLLSFPNRDGRGAGVQLWSGTRAGRVYSTHVYYRSDPRANLLPCADGYLNSDLGNCFVRLDKNWIYELAWYDPEYVQDQMEKERDRERRITIP